MAIRAESQGSAFFMNLILQREKGFSRKFRLCSDVLSNLLYEIMNSVFAPVYNKSDLEVFLFAGEARRKLGHDARGQKRHRSR